MQNRQSRHHLRQRPAHPRPACGQIYETESCGDRITGQHECGIAKYEAKRAGSRIGQSEAPQGMGDRGESLKTQAVMVYTEIPELFRGADGPIYYVYVIQFIREKASAR